MLRRRKEIAVLAAMLCVDDLSQQLSIGKANLESKGFSVHTASSPSAALRILEQVPIDAVLLDYRREVDAEAIALLIRQSYPTLPIVLLSAHSEMSEEFLWCFDDYVLRGATTEELVLTILRLTRPGYSSEARKPPLFSQDYGDHGKSARTIAK
jgi:CheY-like chemotaxis protein